MSFLVKLVDGNPTLEVISTENFRLIFPEASFSKVITAIDALPFGFAPFYFSQMPVPQWNECVIQDTPVPDGSGGYVQSWKTTALVGDELAAAKMAHDKHQRALAVSNIKVTTAAGNQFDGDEESQNRMSRAINGMEAEDTIPWVLADQTIILASQAELKEALRLSGQAMAALWLEPYQ